MVSRRERVAAENARDKVRAYCQQEKMAQYAFGEMLGLCKSTFGRFMGAGKETSGKGSYAYPAILSFFKRLKAEEKKESTKRKREEEKSTLVAICLEARASLLSSTESEFMDREDNINEDHTATKLAKVEDDDKPEVVFFGSSSVERKLDEEQIDQD